MSKASVYEPKNLQTINTPQRVRLVAYCVNDSSERTCLAVAHQRLYLASWF